MRRTVTIIVLALAALAVLGGSAGRTSRASAALSPVVVTIQFDDSNLDQYTAAWPILSRHGMVATFYANSGNIGTADHMSWLQLQDLQANYNEVAGHTIHHADIKKLKPADARQEVCGDRNALLTKGLDVTDFAYPFGSFDAGSEQIVSDCGYNSGRGVAGGTETIPPLDAYATRTPPNPKKATRLKRIEGYITDAQANGGGWVQLVFHHVCDRCDPYAITPAHFEELVVWLHDQEANGVSVETTYQVIGGPVNAPVAP